MDVSYLRIIVIVMGLFCFLAICAWAYSKHAKSGFDEAARLPFADDEAFELGKMIDEDSREGKENG